MPSKTIFIEFRLLWVKNTSITNSIFVIDTEEDLDFHNKINQKIIKCYLKKKKYPDS